MICSIKYVISAGTDFHLTEATSQQAEEEEESEGRFKRGLMNIGRWAEQNSVQLSRQMIIPAAHKNRFQGLLCHASAVG